jgi:hypothetical protein
MAAAFVASFVFVTFHIVRAVATPARDRAVAELDATDPTWRTTALTDARNAKLPPPDQNAAEVAYQAYQMTPKAYRDWETRSESAKWRGDVQNPHLPLKADIAETRKMLGKAREAVELARGVRHLPGGGFPLVFKEPDMIGTLLTKQQYLRQTMSLLSYDAAVRAYDRDGNGSVESVLAILAVARGLGDEPTLISQLIRIAGVAITIGAAERTLCWTDGIDDARLAELERAFATEAIEPRLVYGLRGERAGFFRICENIDSGAFDPSGIYDMIGLRVTTPVVWYVKSRIPAEQTVGLKMFNAMIAAAEMPAGKGRIAAASVAAGEVDALVKKGRVGPVPLYPLIGLLVPAIQKVTEADTRIVAQLNAARVTIACERHRQKVGAYPETLADLPKDLLAEVPNDPFSGKPILYKKLADGAVAYSVGFDGLDDGGTDLTPSKRTQADLGFRLWSPDHRRQPPQPKPPPAFGGGPGLWSWGITPELKPGQPTAPPPLSPWVKKE